MRALLFSGLGVVALGATLLARSIDGYLAAPLAASSTSGVRVFRMPDGSLGGFEPFALGYEPVVIGVGLLLVVAAVLLEALQAPLSSSRNRSAIAGENADAQMR